MHRKSRSIPIPASWAFSGARPGAEQRGSRPISPAKPGSTTGRAKSRRTSDGGGRNARRHRAGGPARLRAPRRSEVQTQCSARRGQPSPPARALAHVPDGRSPIRARLCLGGKSVYESESLDGGRAHGHTGGGWPVSQRVPPTSGGEEVGATGAEGARSVVGRGGRHGRLRLSETDEVGPRSSVFRKERSRQLRARENHPSEARTPV